MRHIEGAARQLLLGPQIPGPAEFRIQSALSAAGYTGKPLIFAALVDSPVSNAQAFWYIECDGVLGCGVKLQAITDAMAMIRPGECGRKEHE